MIIVRAGEFYPFYEYHDAQIDENQRNEYDLRYELEKNAQLPVEIPVIEQAEYEAENHLYDADDDREFHF